MRSWARAEGPFELEPAALRWQSKTHAQPNSLSSQPPHPVTQDSIYILAVLSLAIAVSEWLVRTTFLRHVGTALLVIVVVAVLANTGVIPPFSDKIPVYTGTFSHVAYIGIFWLLLGVNLRDVARAGHTMLVLFFIGALGTSVGVMVGMWVVDGSESIGAHYNGLAGMFAATYTGGSSNYNLVAMEYGVNKEPALFAGAAAVDSLLTTIWMVTTIALPRFLARMWPRAKRGASGNNGAPLTGIDEDTESVHPLDLALLVALGCLAFWGSGVGTAWVNEHLEAWCESMEWRVIRFPMGLTLTTVALVLAQFPYVAKLRGARVLGMFAVYLFLAVIGALCDLAQLRAIGDLAITLSIFATVTVAVHGLIVFGSAAALKLDWDEAAVASQANIGGGTTALALARSLGRGDLVLPAILIGSLGTAVGSYIGMAVAGYLG